MNEVEDLSKNWNNDFLCHKIISIVISLTAQLTAVIDVTPPHLWGTTKTPVDEPYPRGTPPRLEGYFPAGQI